MKGMALSTVKKKGRNPVGIETVMIRIAKIAQIKRLFIQLILSKNHLYGNIFIPKSNIWFELSCYCFHKNQVCMLLDNQNFQRK